MSQTAGLQFTLAESREYADQSRIEEWIHAYLNGPGDNPAFSIGLKRAPRWWVGPIQLPLSALRPALGPTPDFEYTVAPDTFERYITAMQNSLAQGWQPTPLIAEYRGPNHLSLRDGNHRYHAFHRAGITIYWTIIWCNSATDHKAFTRQLTDASKEQS